MPSSSFANEKRVQQASMRKPKRCAIGLDVDAPANNPEDRTLICAWPAFIRMCRFGRKAAILLRVSLL
jgi:hypothetical protein